jgi:hypothetical protein
MYYLLTPKYDKNECGIEFVCFRYKDTINKTSYAHGSVVEDSSLPGCNAVSLGKWILIVC